MLALPFGAPLWRLIIKQDAGKSKRGSWLFLDADPVAPRASCTHQDMSEAAAITRLAAHVVEANPELRFLVSTEEPPSQPIPQRLHANWPFASEKNGCLRNRARGPGLAGRARDGVVVLAATGSDGVVVLAETTDLPPAAAAIAVWPRPVDRYDDELAAMRADNDKHHSDWV